MILNEGGNSSGWPMWALTKIVVDRWVLLRFQHGSYWGVSACEHLEAYIILVSAALPYDKLTISLFYWWSPGSIVPFCKRTLVMLEVCWKKCLLTISTTVLDTQDQQILWKKKYTLIFVEKAQKRGLKRGFWKIKSQKNCPNSILAPMAWKWCHLISFDYLSLILVFDKRKKISEVREKPCDEGLASHHVMLTCSDRYWWCHIHVHQLLRYFLDTYRYRNKEK